jgi:hypothetical protein
MAWVRLEAEHENRAKPWMLVSLRGERLVAKRRTWPWRAITWWHNIWRRRERERIGRAELARLEDRAHRMAAGIPLEDGSKQ